MVLSVQQLGFKYNQKQALDGINFELKQGDFCALLGPNGAGKSTLFALLTRLFPIQQGWIKLNGQDLSSSPASVLSHMGMVFQELTLDLDLSVTENLRYHGSLHGMGWRHCNQRIKEELRRLNLEDRRHDKVRKLNGGHRRRVEICRALLHRPSLLLLDEASAGLDVTTRAKLNIYLRSLCKNDGITVLMSTHLLQEVNHKDHTILLHKGKIHAQGTHQQVCEQLHIKELSCWFNQALKEESEHEWH